MQLVQLGSLREVLSFASKHQKLCYSSYGLYYAYRKTWYEAGDMKPDSNEEKPVTVDSREVTIIFGEKSLNVIQRYYILGLFIRGKKGASYIRRVLNKTQT